MILRLMKTVAPGLDPKAIGDEIRERIDEELDYELEAQNQRTLARIYRGHPFIVVPDVVTSLSPRARASSASSSTAAASRSSSSCPQDERDRIGEIIFRFYFGSMYRHRQFSGDPHPGNCLLLDDGRMAFLDFGLFKRIAAEVAELELADASGWASRGAASELHRAPARAAASLARARALRPRASCWSSSATSTVVVHDRRGDRARRPRSPPR